MGIDVQVLKFLKQCFDVNGDFKKTITIGRQCIHTPMQQIENILNVKNINYKYNDFCEEMLIKHFNSSVVDSIDNSSYENATHIYDLNKPIPENFPKYDTIIDGGCLEHIYQIPQAFKNLSKMCNVGGQIIHILPTNNFSGHGFWQISPELFFSLYSEKNGYKNTEVYLADVVNTNFVLKANKPESGKRHDVNGLKINNPLYVMARTTLAREDFNHENVQQSDYEYIWNS